MEKKIYKSAVVLGLAMATKLIALGSLPILLILVWFVARTRLHLSRLAAAKRTTLYALLALLVPLPWFDFCLDKYGQPRIPHLFGISVRLELGF